MPIPSSRGLCEDHGNGGRVLRPHEASRHEEGEAAEDGDPAPGEDIILARDAHQWVHAVLVALPMLFPQTEPGQQLDRTASQGLGRGAVGSPA